MSPSPTLPSAPPAPRWRRALRLLAWVGLGLPLLALALVLVLLAGLLWLVPAHEPSVTQSQTIAMADVERALQLARAHDPRRAIPGVVRTLRLSQHEAELLVNHAAARVRPSRWKLDFGADRLHVRASLRLPDTPRGSWLNLDLQARQTRGLPQLEAVTLGQLSLPVPLVEWAIERVARRYGLAGEALLASTPSTSAVITLQQVRVLPQRVNVSYAWGADAPARMMVALLPPQEHERLRLYASHLAQLTAALPRQPLSLSQLLPPMFELARQRSADGHDPALENRAALLVLGMVANGVGLAALLPERRAELAARPIQLTLAGRRDSTQHFLVSATLAAESGSPLADLIGLYKEMADARSGSGFSFNDMAANRAGTRLGELAVGSPAQLQQRLIIGLHEEDLLPDVSDLPESLHEREFRQRYGGPGSPAFERLMSDIEDRLGATPLYR